MQQSTTRESILRKRLGVLKTKLWLATKIISHTYHGCVVRHILVRTCHNLLLMGEENFWSVFGSSTQSNTQLPLPAWGRQSLQASAHRDRHRGCLEDRFPGNTHSDAHSFAWKQCVAQTWGVSVQETTRHCTMTTGVGRSKNWCVTQVKTPHCSYYSIVAIELFLENR